MIGTFAQDLRFAWRDPATYTLIAVPLTATAAVAAWRPARRAASVDPTSALRAD